jgi:prevent-host-death family protein
MKMGLKEANQSFSKAIRAVKAGQVVVLTERGKPIATIQPCRPTATEEEAIQQLVAEGAIRQAKRPGPIRDNWKPVSMKRGASIGRILRKFRDDE